MVVILETTYNIGKAATCNTTSTAPFTHPTPSQTGIQKLAKFEIITNQLHTLIRHYTLSVHITLLRLTSAHMEMYNNKVHFFA
jgi:hypothetical protein